jgi:HK97 gp10 family phage protein
MAARITEPKGYTLRLRALAGEEGKQDLGKALLTGGQLVAASAKESVLEGGSSGPGGRHIPSLPGNPPNADTGYLAANIQAEPRRSLLVTITSYARYSKWLEFGTSRMAARPFMRPALQKNIATIKSLVRNARNTVIRRSRG